MSQKQKLIGILVFLVSFSVFYFWVWDDVRGVYDKYLALQEQQEELASLEYLIENRTSFMQEREKIILTASEVFQAVPEKFSEADILLSLASLIGKNGFALKTMSIKKPEDKGLVSVQTVFSGRAELLEGLLRSLERNLPIIDVIAVNLDDPIKQQDFTLEMQTYILPPVTQEEGSFRKIKEDIEYALDVKNLKLDELLKNSQFSTFNAASEIPVSKPASDTVGGRNPFLPLP